MSEIIYRLVPKIQPYAWGKIGNSSKAAELASGADVFEIEEDKPYAELWMGTHPNAPSTVKETGQDLKSVIASNPELSSSQIYKKYNGDLPFLFKVLSINKALSIQSHPDKKLAEHLNKNFGHVYKDDNHKPEMAIGLTPFEGLCGFRPLQEIKKNILNYPEIKEVIGQDVVDEFFSVIDKTGSSNNPLDIQINKAALKKLYKSLMEQDAEVVTKQLRLLISRIKTTDPNPAKGSLNELLLRTEKQYPDDIGNFSILLLNYISLNPGEGLYLAANEPHAYMSGDCVECMAASDNVVRAGLTPKFKDVNTLVEMLTYNYGTANSLVLKGVPYNGSATTRLYDPPIEEFSILRTEFNANSAKENETFEGIKGPSILIVTEGHGRVIYSKSILDAGKGSIFFIGANTKLTLEAVDKKKTTVFFRAYCTMQQTHL